jgi:hypothetical protein
MVCRIKIKFSKVLFFEQIINKCPEYYGAKVCILSEKSLPRSEKSTKLCKWHNKIIFEVDLEVDKSCSPLPPPLFLHPLHRARHSERSEESPTTTALG